MASYTEKGGYCKRCKEPVPVKQKSASHILHLLLTLCTFGVWMIVWFWCAFEKPWRWQCSRCGSKASTRVPRNAKPLPASHYVVSLACIGIFLSSAGCTTLTRFHESKTPEWVAERTTVERDDFKKEVLVQSPKVVGTMGSGYDGEFYRVFFRGWISMRDSRNERFQIYVRARHIGRWHSYHDAWDQDGKQLRTISISRKVNCSGGCWYTEDVGIDVDRAYLEAHLDTGIRLKVDGTGGDVVATIPAGYIAGFLDRMNGVARTARHAKR